MIKENEKFSCIREKIEGDDINKFDSAYNALTQMVYQLLGNVSATASNREIDTIDYTTGFEMAKIINTLGKKAGVEIAIPETNEYLFNMYLIKILSDTIYK